MYTNIIIKQKKKNLHTKEIQNVDTSAADVEGGGGGDAGNNINKGGGGGGYGKEGNKIYINDKENGKG